MRKYLSVLISLLTLSASQLSAEDFLENYIGDFIKEVVPIQGFPSGQANALSIDGNVLYCGTGRHIVALDLTYDRVHPTVLSSVEIYGLVRQMTVQEGVLYAACRESGVWIVDVSDPRKLRLISRYDPVELATGIEVSGDVLFLGTRQNGVECVDVSDPAHPVHIRMEKTDESQSVTYRDGILYSGEWGGHAVTVIDARDMSKLKTLRKVTLQGYGDGVWTSGNYLYAATGHHLTDKSIPWKDRTGKGHGLEIFDISQPTNPSFVSRISFDECYRRSNDFWTPRPCSDGKYVLVADTFNGLYAVDTKDVAHPFLLSRLSFTRNNGEAAAVTSLAIGNGTVYISVSGGCGFYALVCPDVYPDDKGKGKSPDNASYRDTYPTSKFSHFKAWKPEQMAPVRGVAVYGNIIYAACSYGGLNILRYGKKGAVELLGRGPMEYAGDVKVCGNLLWVAEGFAGLAVYKIGNGSELTFITRYTDFFKDGPSAACLWVFTPTNSIVAAGTRTGEYYYLDVSNLPKIRFKGYLGMGPGWDKYLSNRADSHGWYPATRHKVGIMWINLNESKLQEIKDDSIIPSLTDGVCLFRDDSFLTCKDGAVYVFSSNKMKSVKYGEGEGFYGMPVWDGNKKLGLTYRIEKTISMGDVKAGVEPLILWSEKTSGYPETGVFLNGKFIVPCGYQGLLIEK